MELRGSDGAPTGMDIKTRGRGWRCGSRDPIPRSTRVLYPYRPVNEININIAESHVIKVFEKQII
jgi:hypothetical protein